MTNPRPALCHTKALLAVANRLTWGRVASIARRGERHVRKWSEPHLPEVIPLPVALELDIAFVADGGAIDEAPFSRWYQARLQLACEAARLDRSAPTQDRIAVAARETGEAIAAQLLAIRPGATLRDRAVAREETEEAIVALAAALPATSIEIRP